MSKIKVLVTGGAGYIGSHTVVELYSAGYQPIIADNLSNSSIDVLDGIEKIVGEKPLFEQIDCTDYNSLVSLLEKYGNIQYAIHFAAFKAVGESVQKPLVYYNNNLVSLMNLIEAMNFRGKSSIVFSSSCTVYGQPSPEHLPVSEEAPLQPAASPYGKTKQICEDILKDSVNAFEGNLDVISLRYFNPIGAHPSANIGELPIGVLQNLLPFVAQTAAGIRKELSVFGDDYNTPDGSCIRDYIYVCDLAKAHVAAIDRLKTMATLKKAENTNAQDFYKPVDEPNFLVVNKTVNNSITTVDSSGNQASRGLFECFNIGTGKGLSVLEVIETFKKANSVEVPYKIVARRAGDIEQVWANPTKANKILNWVASTPLEEVMKSAWKWQQKLT
ncbi:MAG: UDP-glucose 4-epimerase GalE [Bacteroidales bacterium]